MCVREREREREREISCVYVRDREREISCVYVRDRLCVRESEAAATTNKEDNGIGYKVV